MNPMHIDPTDETPGIELDAETGMLKMWGKSLPEDVTTFFTPVLEWLHQYAQTPSASTVFDFNMAYFNTASSKLILDILLKLEEIAEEGNGVKIIWNYLEDDEDMEEAGEEFSEIVEVEFELVAN